MFSMLKRASFAPYFLFLFSAFAFSEIRVEMPNSVNQGSFFKIKITDDQGAFGKYHVTWISGAKNPKSYHGFALDQKTHLVFVPVDVEEEAGEVAVKIIGPFDIVERKIIVSKVEFPVSAGVFVIGRQTNAARKRREMERIEIKEIFSAPSVERYFDENLKFTPPLSNIEITSPFGKIRKKRFVGKREIYFIHHRGVDLRAATGTSVFAVESGVVRAAKNFLGSGNMVIIDHGQGFFSLYLHLFRIRVRKGESVGKGKLIASSGRSGSVEGPHLHFETALHGVKINPMDLLEPR